MGGTMAAAPLSFAQERLWLLQRLAPSDVSYNLTRAYRLRGRPDAAALERALTALAWRHAVLRTRFEERDGAPVQIVLPVPAVTLSRETLTGDLDRRLTAEARRPFDLAAAPPLRVTLLTVAADEHVLVLAMHHILSDGPSNPILARDLLTAYAKALADEDADPADLLLPLTVQYADYAREQRSAAAVERAERAVERTLERLEGGRLEGGRLEGGRLGSDGLGRNIPALDLPTDRPRPPERSGQGGRVAVPLPESAVAGLRAFGRSEGCTPFVILLAAWQILLARWSGQIDFAVGVPNAGRFDEAYEPLVGFFVDTQIFRARLSAGMTGRTLCRRLRDDARGALDHGPAPFERLLERLAPPRDPSRTPLFQTMLDVQTDNAATVWLPGLTVEPIAIAETTAKVDLALNVVLAGDAASASIDHAADLFDAATAGRLAAAFATVLSGLLADPDKAWEALPLLDGAARERELTGWNDTALPLDPAEDLVALFERSARDFPDCVAARFGSVVLTYGALNRRANRLARWLAGRGVGAEAIVAIALPRGPDLLAGLLAIQKAGGAYLPLDPDQPAARNAHILAHAAPALTIDQPLDELVPDADRLDGGDLGRPVAPGQLAYTLYTSGSTGTPKGVQIDRQAFASLLHAMQAQVGLGPDDRLLAVTTVGFDIAGLELFLPLVTGGRVVVATREEASDPQALARLIDEQGITAMQATPATWRMLLDATESRWPGLTALCGGEALSADLAARLLDRGVRLLNVYGPTETTVWSAAWPVSRPVAGPVAGPVGETGARDAVVPIGHAIANNRLHLLDERLEPVPHGAVGDLWIGGLGLARGYARRPDLTAAVFVPNPFQQAGAPGCGAGSRLYRTGDRARRRPDGAIEFLGRRDHQMKVRGFRIEAAEVEAALESHPAVRQAVAVARTPPDGETMLCAYVVAAEGVDDTADLRALLRGHVASRLPGYMVPSVIVALERLPLNANGKVDRKALPAAAVAAPSGGSTLPATGTERQLAALWDEVLDRRDADGGGSGGVGVEDDFFALGGHSLRLVRLQTRIRTVFGCELPLAELMRAPTVRAMAALIDARGPRDEAGDLAFMANLLDTL